MGGSFLPISLNEPYARPGTASPRELVDARRRVHFSSRDRLIVGVMAALHWPAVRRFYNGAQS